MPAMHTQSQLLLLLLLQGIKRIAYLETAPMYRRRSSTPAPGAPAATGITFSPAPQPAPPAP